MQPIGFSMPFLAGTFFVPLLIGCGGGGGSANARENDGASGSASKAVAPSATRSACDVLTAEDVAQIQGQPMEAWPDEASSPYESVCQYGPAGASREWGGFLALKVYWRDGKEGWRIWGAGRSLGAKMLQDPEVPVDSIMRGDPLADIGDGAHYGDIMPSLVLKGDTLLEFTGLLENAEEFALLARKALSRL